jgi:cytochrome c biogenesis protein CcdA
LWAPNGAASVTPVQAFVAAVGLTIVGMPGAVPFLGAIGQVLKADLSPVNTITALIFYNVIFVLPLVVFVLIRQMFSQHAGPLIAAVGRIAEVWGKRIITVLLIILGLLMIIDGIGWFLGHSLIPV